MRRFRNWRTRWTPRTTSTFFVLTKTDVFSLTPGPTSSYILTLIWIRNISAGLDPHSFLLIISVVFVLKSGFFAARSAWWNLFQKCYYTSLYLATFSQQFSCFVVSIPVFRTIFCRPRSARQHCFLLPLCFFIGLELQIFTLVSLRIFFPNCHLLGLAPLGLTLQTIC